MDLLDTIRQPDDVKRLGSKELAALAAELRKVIIRTVSETGGHLSSNLGVVELTLAILREFDPQVDRIIWDVGHQCYAYKLLTGRACRFSTLRRLGGLSGFPKREESPCDCFNTGHSSTSISAALGLLRANRLLDRTGRVVAVIGDGALGGGMALEAMNDAGQSGQDLIVILNDNQMSISRNVGSLSRHLENIRMSARYLRVKSRVSAGLMRIPLVGRPLVALIERLKSSLRTFIHGRRAIFEDFGFQYFGPVDGHSLEDLQAVLHTIRSVRGPVLLHVCTQKGKGYDLAEREPHLYHGVPPFAIETGTANGSAGSAGMPSSFSDVFGLHLASLASRDPSIVAISAAMRIGTGLDGFAEAFPARFFDVGIAEQHAVTMAAGLAAGGLRPVVALYSTFLQRAYDQVLHDVALQRLPVVFAIDRAGIVGEDGETHQGIYDIAFLSCIPGLILLSPSDYAELESMLEWALACPDGPVAIRYPRGRGVRDAASLPGATGSSERPADPLALRLLRPGRDLTILSVGAMAVPVLSAAERLEREHGILCEVLDARAVKPMDWTGLSRSLERTGCLMTVEDGTLAGGFGASVAATLSRHGIRIPLHLAGVSDAPLPQGSRSELHIRESLDSDGLVRRALSLLRGEAGPPGPDRRPDGT